MKGHMKKIMLKNELFNILNPKMDFINIICFCFGVHTDFYRLNAFSCIILAFTSCQDFYALIFNGWCIGKSLLKMSTDIF